MTVKGGHRVIDLGILLVESSSSSPSELLTSESISESIPLF